MEDLKDLRAHFPVLETQAYLNAGTDGPLPAAAVAAARAELERELAGGRTHTHFERRKELEQQLRQAYAGAMGCAVEDLALTTCTTEGMAQVLMGLDLRPGDEVLTSDEEHPGLLGALGALRESGVKVREAPFMEVHEAVTPSTTLVACSHVSWVNGQLAPAELGQLDIPVLLDGAQGLGALHLDMAALGCDAYAGAGQKWLCGPDGSGALWVSAALRERLRVPRRGYTNLEDPGTGLAARLHPDSRRFEAPSLSAEAVACSLGSAELLSSYGWQAISARAVTLAGKLAGMLAAAGRVPAPRGPTTLVSFPSEDPESERARLADAGVIVRNIPNRPLLRASVGAWNDESDLERLLQALVS